MNNIKCYCCNKKSKTNIKLNNIKYNLCNNCKKDYVKCIKKLK